MKPETIVRSRPHAITETSPPKRWRNHYRVDKPINYILSHGSVMVGPGEFASAETFPSKDVAETHDRERFCRAAQRGWLPQLLHANFSYLGAHPEDQDE